MTKADLLEEPCAGQLACTVLQTSGGSDPFAEFNHAIKQFAYYREHTVGTVTEKGLSDYLILLSLCQTCRYKGVSFLQFLLSKERNVEEFAQRKRRSRPRLSVELYPRGFVPPHLANAHKRRLQQVHGGEETLQ